MKEIRNPNSNNADAKIGIFEEIRKNTQENTNAFDLEWVVVENKKIKNKKIFRGGSVRRSAAYWGGVGVVVVHIIVWSAYVYFEAIFSPSYSVFILK